MSPVDKFWTPIRQKRNVYRLGLFLLLTGATLFFYFSSHSGSSQSQAAIRDVVTQSSTEKGVAPVEVEDRSGRGNGVLTSRQLNFTEYVCDETNRLHQGNHVKHKVVLWSKGVHPHLHSRLHDGFPAYQLEANERPTSSNGELDRCWVYTDLPRAVHPSPPKLKPRDLIFGVATGTERLLVKNAVTSHWLHGSDTNLYVHIPKTDAADGESRVAETYKDFGLASVSVERDPNDVDQTMQYARLSASMYELTQRSGMEHVQWFIHMDDDTLVTSAQDYARMLEAHDSSKPIYVGAHSESSSTLWRDGRGAWGGASIAVSRALARQLSERWSDCLAHERMEHTIYGDHKLDACVAYLQGRTTQQPDMQIEYSLHQLDFFGSIDGILRSGIKWLTLHHFGWVNLFPYPDGPGGTPAKTKKIANSAKVLGTGGLFRNYLLKHDDSGATILTNGYALTQFLTPLSRHELEMVERTYEQHNPSDYEAAFGPTRDPKQEGTEKKTYFVTDVATREVDGVVVGSSWRYRHERNGVTEDIIVEWML